MASLGGSGAPELELRSSIFQPLEQRLMLDIGGASQPPTIVVGRTLSAYDLPDVQNNRETITLTVYNQAADPITGVLLTDTLGAGVTFASASQLPDQHGQQLAWSLGAIQPYDRASVTLTVSLASPTPTQIDTGASAYGTLDAGMVSWTTAPATLRTTAIAGGLLASTPDANTADPYVQEKAAELNYDPQQIYSFLQTQIGYNSYAGSLRGARGTLWSDAGNSLDDASLGVALMRASGIPAQYEEGTLTTAQAQQLILSMFPASYQTVGYITAGTPTADPANDPHLLSETQDHFWFQFDSGGGMKDADPEFAGQTTGQAATTSSNHFTEVPASLRQTTEIQLTAEIYSQAAAAFGLSNGLSDTVVLDQTFNDVDLIGKAVSVGNLVNSSSPPGIIITATTNTYSPYLAITDEANSSVGNDQVIQGKDYQEFLTNFPLGSQFLSGLFLTVKSTGLDTPAQTFERSIVDRIGFAGRQNGTTAGLAVNPNSPPILSDFDVTTVNVFAGDLPASALSHVAEASGSAAKTLESLSSQQAGISTAGAGLSAATSSAATDALRSFLISRALYFAFLSNANTSQLGSASFVVSYDDQPRVVLAAASLPNQSSATPQLSISLDLAQDNVRAVTAPGHPAASAYGFNFARGISESVLEAKAMDLTSALGANATTSGTVTSAVSVAAIFEAANQQNVNQVLIGPSNLNVLNSLNISANAKARITDAVNAGNLVLVPSRSISIDGASRVAWYQINASTGNTVGVLDDGSHGIGEYLLNIIIFITKIKSEETFLAAFFGFTFGALAEDLQFAAILLIHPPVQVKGINSQKATMAAALAEATALTLAEGQVIAIIIAGFDPTLASAFQAGWKLGVSAVAAVFAALIAHDPPLPSGSVNLNIFDSSFLPSNSRQQKVSAAKSLTAGTVTGQSNVRALAVSGVSAGSWTSTATSSLSVSSISATTATVSSASGQPLGAGTIAVNTTTPTSTQVSGNVQYSVTGQGSLSLYGPSEQPLGVSANWNNYSAALSGNISMTLTTGGLLLNGQPLPAGTYIITTNSATVGGSGLTTSPNFAGAVSLTASSGTVELGAGTGNLTVAGAPLSTSNEATFVGYNGSLNVTANGDGTDAVTLNGNAANLLALAPSPATLTADQNTPASFNANVSTSFADTYTVTATGPIGWTVSVDETGKVTVTPAPRTQGGTYPIQVVAQSTTNSDLVAQGVVEVTVTPTTPGMTLSVTPDTEFTVPFNGTQLPTAFRSNVQNTGPAADTYNLTFSSPPAGFALVTSGTSVTVPAGQTGILGLYLVPTSSQLPPPATNLSFTVTATSVTNPTITQTVHVSFVMPTIDAVTVTGNPTQVTSTPGSPTTATVTITNVGNVTASTALSTATGAGLSASGLPSTPVSVGVGQSTSQTITLTPAASAALNSTLTATVSAGPAATQDSVSVVSVSATAQGASGAPQDTAFAGESVDVTADILSGVLQPRQALASYTLNSGSGTVFTSSPVTITLGSLPADNSVDLGPLSTTGLAAGQYTINVTITETGGQPITGATGTGTLLIDSAVAATLAVDAETVSPGTNTVTSTLTVANQPVPGAIPTDGSAASVAVNGTLAYVAGTHDVNIVDISNPASPQIVGTFGAGQLNSAGTNFVRLAGNDLLVATQDQSNANAFDLLVYTLANPKSPALAGSVTVPYASLNGMTVEGTTAYFTTSGITYDPSSGSISQQFGDVAAVDFSNPASPQFLGVGFNDLGSPQGHNGAENDLEPITSSLAYVAGSTSTGPSTQTGTGRILLVNTSNPSSMSVTGELDLPGTVQALAVAVDGNTALVVGSSGGLLSPFGDSSNIQLSGNVTLTLLDISNPAAPKIIGSTIVTQESLATSGEFPTGKLQAVDLGGDRFAINGTLLNGAIVVMTVDASTPTNPAISTLAVSAPVTGLAAAGGELLATSSNGLQVLQANTLADTSVTAEVDVPNTGATLNLNSFSTPPTQIVPGANSERLIWTLSLAPGASRQIIWQS
ncbi:MAG TPA: transglutaminase domain-containing protein, partial [Pirellulales bacterium]|nr:transglutaminase domain-containing protein [Pirellulales bacterium]